MIMHAGLFPAARGNEILIGKPMRLDMDQGYPGHWTVRDAANACHTEWSRCEAADFYGWKYSTVVPASHSGFEFSAPYQDFPIAGAYIILGTCDLDNMYGSPTEIFWDSQDMPHLRFDKSRHALNLAELQISRGGLGNYNPPQDGTFEEIWLERCRQAGRIRKLVAYWSRVDPLCPDNSRAVERWNALSSLRKPKGPFEC